MKSLDVSDSTGKASFQACELTTRSNLLRDEFFKLNSNFTLKSTFKTPNVKSHHLLKEDFYAALSAEDMLTGSELFFKYFY